MNNTNEVVIIYYLNGCRMENIYVEKNETININDCDSKEWIVLTRTYKRIGKFWELPAVNGLRKIIEIPSFDFILTGDVWSLESVDR